MITIFDDETLAAAEGQLTDQTLRDLIARIVHDARASGLWSDLTCILVVEPDDTAETISDTLGFSPLEGPFGEAGSPYWTWLDAHRGWHEMLLTVGNGGFAYFLLIPACGLDRSGLGALCRASDLP